MGTYTFAVPIVYAAQSNNTYAAKRIYKIGECEDTLIPNTEADLWCKNLCGNDEPYYNPFIKGDKIYVQYKSDNSELWKVLVKIYDGSTNEQIASDGLVTTQAGKDDNGNSYLNLLIDTTDMPVSCWYYKVILFDCDVDVPTYEACVNAALANGDSEEVAEYNCSVTLCGAGVSEIISEPYKEVTCEKTILITGSYKTFDCNGNYYGDLQVGDTTEANIYKSEIRVPGEIFKEKYNFQQTIVENEKQRSLQLAGYRLLTYKLPPYVVDKMAVCFNSKTTTIDGTVCENFQEMAKNNEDGQMWIINSTFTSHCDEINFVCTN